MNIIFAIYFFSIIAVYFIALPQIFKKVNIEPWKGYVPVYNWITMLKLIEKPWWWVFLLIFPGVNVVMFMVFNVSLARYYGRFDAKETLLAIFLPQYTLLDMAFGKKELKPFGLTNWDKEEHKKIRSTGDHIVLALCSFGIGHALIGVFRLLGSKPKPGKKTMIKDWGDAIVFALVAASIIRTYTFEPYQIPTPSMEKTLERGDFLFVNKVAYGSRIPNTPLSYPLVHNIFPWINTKSYLEWWKIDYMRAPGYTWVERNDVTVFNFPAGDTAIYDPGVEGLMGHDYYAQVRSRAYVKYMRSVRGSFEEKFRTYPKYRNQYENSIRKELTEKYGLVYRPVDKRENYIKRCVAVAGDVLEIKNHVLYINGEEAFQPEMLQFGYTFHDNIHLKLNADIMKESYDLNQQDFQDDMMSPGAMNLSLNKENLAQLKASFGEKIEKQDKPKGYYSTPSNEFHQMVLENTFYPIFPNDPKYDWTEDNFGPLTLPKKGVTVEINPQTIPLYRKIIAHYEGHQLEEKKDGIYIDGKKADKYTFEMNYYFMMGDNRDRSADSRYWGFVPEDHILGKGSFIWFSRDPFQSFFQGIRWHKVMTSIK